MTTSTPSSAATRVALITGCSSGIGRELVSALLRSGWMVFATMRGADQRRELFAQDVKLFGDMLRVVSLDVTSEWEAQSVATLIDRETDGRLDLLVNNAGYGLFGALEDCAEYQVREQFEVNVFGLIRVTQKVLPLLRKSKGKVVNISSVLGFSGLPFASLYCASKHSVEGLTESLYYELAPFGVQVSLVEPGGHRTQFGSNLVWGNKANSESSVYRSRTADYQRYMERLRNGDGSAPSSDVVEAIVALVNKPKMPLRVQVGSDSRIAKIAKHLIPSSLLYPIVRWGMQRVIRS